MQIWVCWRVWCVGWWWMPWPVRGPMWPNLYTSYLDNTSRRPWDRLVYTCAYRHMPQRKSLQTFIKLHSISLIKYSNIKLYKLYCVVVIQVPTEPGYDVTLTLMVPEPHRTKVDWDAKAAVNGTFICSSFYGHNTVENIMLDFWQQSSPFIIIMLTFLMVNL